MPESKESIVHRVTLLRQRMKAHGINFYLISTSDPHHNEYVPPCWQWRAFISGFKGSNGHVCITQKEAFLWTDSRYFIEAESAIEGTPFRLMKMGAGGDISLEEYLKKQAHQAIIGLDAEQWSMDAFTRLEEAVKGLDVTWKISVPNLLESIWQDRPAVPSTPVQWLDQTYTGQSTHEKLQALREHMHTQGAAYHVLSHLDAIAWLLNIRATDIPYNPLCISYLIVDLKEAHWFVNSAAIPDSLRAPLQQSAITLHPYADCQSALARLSGAVWVDPKKTSIALQHSLQSCTLILQASSIDLEKACKNKTEQEGMQQAHQEDGVAMVRFMDWLMREGLGKGEIVIAQMLESFRQKSTQYRGPSFQTISGFGAHGAIVHYAASQESEAIITADNLFLLDSGGQYLCGTTDITRVFHLGHPTEEMKAHYTRVLKGHIALARIIFPEGTKGAALDVLARAALWEQGLDFGHGTGHGVGCYLCVHEGPQGISSRAQEVLQEGMILSNEPGYYRAGYYGIRIENLMRVVRHPHFPGFLQFDILTLCPYERKLMDLRLLTPEEIQWMDAYHARVKRTLLSIMKEDDLSIQTSLSRFTAPLVA